MSSLAVGADWRVRETDVVLHDARNRYMLSGEQVLLVRGGMQGG
jgi:hypothetical protein